MLAVIRLTYASTESLPAFDARGWREAFLASAPLDASARRDRWVRILDCNALIDYFD